MKVLYIIRGVPGSGKTTLAEIIKIGCKQICLSVCGPLEADHFMHVDGVYKFNPARLQDCHNACFEACLRAMQDGVDVVIQSNTNTRKSEYARYVEAAKEYGYEVQEIICKGNWQNVHGVPEEVVQEMKKRFEY